MKIPAEAKTAALKAAFATGMTGSAPAQTKTVAQTISSCKKPGVQQQYR